jgi:hypothetical protein
MILARVSCFKQRISLKNSLIKPAFKGHFHQLEPIKPYEKVYGLYYSKLQGR